MLIPQILDPSRLRFTNTAVRLLRNGLLRSEMVSLHSFKELLIMVEFASFTPLVFATTGGMGKEAITFYRRLAELLSKHSALSYSSTLAWIRCTLSFSLLRSATMCIRGSRSISFRSPDASPEMGLTNGPRDF